MTPSSSVESESLPLRALKRGLGAPRAGLERLAGELVERGLPPALLGYRRARKVPFARYLQEAAPAIVPQIIHPRQIARNPLPRNIAQRDELPDDSGWWTFSFRDVPKRVSGPTARATVNKALVVPCEDDRGQFWVSIFSENGASIELREISYRPWQAEAIRRKRRRRIERATWVLERVYDNHSHWLTAHLPKILLLKERGELAETLWPEALPQRIVDCLALYGIDVKAFPTFGPDELLEVDELTLLSTDRFRPELLQKVRDHCPIPAPSEPHRRVYISRSKAERRRLVNEEAIWPKFERAGFERVHMEDLSFEEQIRLMRETAVLAAPHGAGLTNMIFCAPGTQVVEMADLDFPNPNFYALACGVGLRYWLVRAEGVGEGHPLTRDMRADPAAIDHLMEEMMA